MDFSERLRIVFFMFILSVLFFSSVSSMILFWHGLIVGDKWEIFLSIPFSIPSVLLAVFYICEERK